MPWHIVHYIVVTIVYYSDNSDYSIPVGICYLPLPQYLYAIRHYIINNIPIKLIVLTIYYNRYALTNTIGRMHGTHTHIYIQLLSLNRKSK